MKKNNKGFTLAEMLIVVAIIGVLVGIITPTISNSIEKAKEAKDLANLRSAYSRMAAMALTDEEIKEPFFYDKYTGTIKVFVKCTSEKDGWQIFGGGTSTKIGGTSCSSPNKDQSYFRLRYVKSTGAFEFNRYYNSKLGTEFTTKRVYNNN